MTSFLGATVLGSTVLGSGAWGSTTLVATVVAQPTTPPADEGGQGEDFGKSSPVGFVVLLLFFIAVVFLVRSMNKHLRRVPETFDRPADEPTEHPTEHPTQHPTERRTEHPTDGDTTKR